MTASPRVLVASLRGLKPLVPFAGSYEFEDMVASVSGADVVSLEHAPRPPRPLLDRALTKAGDTLSLTLERRARVAPVRVAGKYDLFFIRVMSPADIQLIDHIQGWDENCATTVIQIEEIWPPMLRFEKMFRPLSRFDHIYVGHKTAAPRLADMTGTPCTYLPPAVDALRFCPYPDPPERHIDFYAMGRRSGATHEALRAHAMTDPGFYYVYDSARPREFTVDATQHRDLMAGLIQRSKFFLADRAKVDEPRQTAGSHVYGPRFFEGAAAGAILVGDPPDCDHFREDFDWPDAVLSVPYGSTEIVRIIRDFAADEDRVRRARRANIVNMLGRHDWLHRWTAMMEGVGLGPGGRAQERLDALRSLRELVASTGE